MLQSEERVMLRQIVPLLLAVSLTTAAMAQEDRAYYMVGKEQVNLLIDDTAILVTDDRDRPDDEIAAYLTSAGLEDFSSRPLIPKRHMFQRAAAAPGAGSRPSIRELIRTVSGRPDNTFYLSPVFLDADGGDEPGRLIMDPRILVRFNEGTPQGWAESVMNSTIPGRIEVRGWLDDENTFIYKVFSNSALVVLEHANRLAAMPEVSWATPHLHVSGGPSQVGGSCDPVALDADPAENPDFGLSWGLQKVRAEEAWALCGGSPANVVLVVFDDGVDPNHSDINQLLPGRNFTDTDGCPGGCIEIGGEPRDPCDSHGTTVSYPASGIINNGVGSAGIAPNVKIISVRTF